MGQLNALDLIHALRTHIQEHTSPCFASREDCEYFRAAFRAQQRVVAAQEPPPPPPPQPKAAPLSLLAPSATASLPLAQPLNLETAIGLRQEMQSLESKLIAEKLDHSHKEKTILSENDSGSKNCVSWTDPIVVSRLGHEPIPKPPNVPNEPRSQQPPLILEDRFDDVRKILSKCAPQLALLKEPPNDASAQKIASRWKTKNQGAPFSLLSFHESPSHQKLLTNLTSALDVVYGGARLIAAEGIEQAKQWEAFLSVADLKLIIVCDSTLWQMPNLLQFYRELPNRSERFLLNIPVFLLPDLTLYLKDPLLKRSLWKALCQKII
jgi:hypothetical protein